ncbi:hypothetical protein C8Q77DRAFT_1143436 [Trametes polyzona]|nr:hypothetical protein C8Q77DRAFT_1143436 [Trametes polyzona]
MSYNPNIVSPRPQKNASSFAKVLNWQESEPVPGMVSGAVPRSHYTYLKCGGAYEQRVLAQGRIMAKYAASCYYATALLNPSLENQAPPWPPALPHLQAPPAIAAPKPKPITAQALLEDIIAGTKATAPVPATDTFIGRDGAIWPMPPPECLPGGALSQLKAYPSYDPPAVVPRAQESKPEPAAPLPLAVCASPSPAPSTDSELESDSEATGMRTPLSHELSLAELGREWYATFGEEVKARPLPSIWAARDSEGDAAVRKPPRVFWPPHATKPPGEGLTPQQGVETSRWAREGGLDAGGGARAQENPWRPHQDELWGPSARQRRW